MIDKNINNLKTKFYNSAFLLPIYVNTEIFSSMFYTQGIEKNVFDEFLSTSEKLYNKLITNEINYINNI